MAKTCSIPDCQRPASAARGWCWAHYRRWRATGDPLLTPSGKTRPPSVPNDPMGATGNCIVEDCDRPAAKRRMCHKHYLRQYRTGSTELAQISRPHGTCTVPGCDGRAKGLGLCKPHYDRKRKTGVVGGPLSGRKRMPAVGPCTDPECDAPAAIRGLCNRHYSREWKRKRRPPGADS